jgi:pilus assembly protein CpaF
MFSIIISEKGGAERRETFDKNEINVGRVQGNDLMLPKGNVSKHHARLLYRDGRFIVTDLKSTNGTYVNGRKIAQATIVREGDKIYIGDFVLRLDAGGASGGDVAANNDNDESVRTLARNQPNAPAQQPVPPAPPPPAMAPQQAPRLMGQAAGGAAYAEREEEEIPPPPKAPAAQPAPRPAAGPAANVARGQTLALQGNQQQPQRQTAQSQQQPQRSPSTVASAAAQQVAPAPPQQAAVTSPAAQASLVAPPMVIAAAAPRVAPRETAAQAGRRLALITLVDRIADTIDLAALRTSPVVDEALAQSIEKTAREQAAAMREEGEAPEGTDLDSLAADAHRELVALGPIAALLEDDEVTEIQCARNDQVLAVRQNMLVHADAAFTSDEALGRVIGRLAHQAGFAVKPGELVIERRLSRGAHMIAVAPPASVAHALIIRKRRKVDATLEDLVRANTMSPDGRVPRCVRAGTRQRDRQRPLGDVVGAPRRSARVGGARGRAGRAPLGRGRSANAAGACHRALARRRAAASERRGRSRGGADAP